MKINNEKKNNLGPPLDPLCPQFLRGSIASSPLKMRKIRNVMPPYLKTLFEQKNISILIRFLHLESPEKKKVVVIPY